MTSCQYDRHVTGTRLPIVPQLGRLSREGFIEGTGTNETGNAEYDFYNTTGERYERNTTLTFPPVGVLGYNVQDEMDDTGWAYDANGNVINSPGGIVDSFDTENRMVKRVDGTTTTTMGYDHEGNRVWKHKDANGTHTTLFYLVDTLNPTGYPRPVLETWSNNSNPTPGGGVFYQAFEWGDRLLSFKTWINTTYYIGHDGHGSVRMLLSGAGTIVSGYEFDYDAFGNQISTNSTTVDVQFRFASEIFDTELNLYYNTARMFHPLTGRFWQRDSVLGDPNDPRTLNLFAYCAHDPVNHVDPTGHEFNLVGLMSAMGIQSSGQTMKAGPEAAVKVAVRQWAKELRNLATLSDQNENRQIARTAEALWGLRLSKMNLSVVNLGDGVGRHGPDMVAYGWQGNRFRIIIAEVKGTRQQRGLSLLNKLVDGTMQMSIDWLSDGMSTMANAFVRAIGGILPPGPVQQGFETALNTGTVDLYLLRARDLRDNRWETKGYRLISAGDPKSVQHGGKSGIDDIEQPQIQTQRSY